MIAISLESASVVTEKSRSTLWRRVSDGELTKLTPDGKRAMLSLPEVAPLILVPMDGDALARLAQADAGDPEAQDDMGHLFLAAGKSQVGVYWLEQAAKQDYPNAMHRLGVCHAEGLGVARDDELALMWIAKAAAHGHRIAQSQMKALKSRAFG